MIFSVLQGCLTPSRTNVLETLDNVPILNNGSRGDHGS